MVIDIIGKEQTQSLWPKSRNEVFAIILTTFYLTSSKIFDTIIFPPYERMIRCLLFWQKTLIWRLVKILLIIYEIWQKQAEKGISNTSFNAVKQIFNILRKT